ncbi:MAG: hypothetical protein JWM98_282 [Thermoleophilia bacterium]|nr:hypothetical protein [Thermoleophilia bacterium]
MSDSVSLSFPRDSRYYAVARLVVGGMAAPLEMSYDALDDLQLAISSLLDHEDLATSAREDGGLGDVHLRLRIEDHRLEAAIGSFSTGSLDRAFERSATDAAGGLGLQRLLSTIVDDVRVGAGEEAGDGDGEWITLTKQVKALA